MDLEINEFEKRILHQIDERNVSNLLQDLIRIPSPNPPGDTRKIADFLINFLKEQGIFARRIWKDNMAVNVVGRVRGNSDGKTLLLNAHIDTVPIGGNSKWNIDPLKGYIRDGKIFGRGATDCKGGVAAILSAIQAILKAKVKFKGEIIITLVAGEETLSENGTAFLLKKGHCGRPNGVIIAEPTTLPSGNNQPPLLQIFTASRGMAVFEVTVEGKSVHAKLAPIGINAIEKMAKIIIGIQNLNLKNPVVHPLCGRPTINVGLIHGGTNPNIVPDFCQIKVNRDIIPGEIGRNVYQELMDIIKELQEKDKDIKAVVKSLFIAEPVEISENEEVVKVLIGACKSVLGYSPRIGGMIGTNDSRFFIEKGIPAAICGPGITTQSHIVDEHIELQALLNAVKVYAISIVRFLC